jgi:hypothetical protein
VNGSDRDPTIVFHRLAPSYPEITDSEESQVIIHEWNDILILLFPIDRNKVHKEALDSSFRYSEQGKC